MSKRQFDPVRELNDDGDDGAKLHSDTGIAPSATIRYFYDIETWRVQDYSSMPGMPRQSEYHGPSYMNPARYGHDTMSSSIRQLLNQAAMLPLCNQ